MAGGKPGRQVRDRRGVLTRGLGDMVSLCPAMIIDDEQIDDLMTRMGLALDDTLAWARAQGHVG